MRKLVLISFLAIGLSGCADRGEQEKLKREQAEIDLLKARVDAAGKERKLLQDKLDQQEKIRQEVEIELRLARLELDKLRGQAAAAQSDAGVPEQPGEAEAGTGPAPAAGPDAGPDEGGSGSARELRNEGTEAYKKGRYEEAIRFYKEALKANPGDHELHRLLGSVYARMGKRKKAYQSYKQYVKDCPHCMYAPVVKKILEDYKKLDR